MNTASPSPLTPDALAVLRVVSRMDLSLGIAVGQSFGRTVTAELIALPEREEFSRAVVGRPIDPCGRHAICEFLHLSKSIQQWLIQFNSSSYDACSQLSGTATTSMDLELSASQTAFRDEVRRFVEDRLPADIRERLRLGHPPRKQDTVTWQRILNEKGWAAPHWPREYGGSELGQAERLILLDELFRAPAPLPQVFNVGMLGPVLLKFGTQAQKRFFMPKLANLDIWFCQGFSEPGSGSDLASLRTSAKREGDQYIVNGQKIWTTTAHLADWVFALVRTDNEGKKQHGISFLLIDLRTPGIAIRPITSIDGQHHLNEVFFDEVRVPVENLVGEEGRGWDCAKYLLMNERTAIANVGLCRERLDYARELAGRLTQAGKPLLDSPKLRSEMAMLDAEVRALEITNWRFLLSPNTAQKNPGFASVLKLKGTDLQQDIAQLLQRIAGPSALERRPHDGEGAEHWAGPLAMRYFYSRAASIYGGTSEVQKDILSKTILG